MYIGITIFIVIAALAMILVVLVQNSKGGGLSSNFVSSNQFMSVHKQTDLVEKITWTLATIIIVLSIVAAAFLPKHTAGTSEIENIINTQVPMTNQGFEKQAPVAPAGTETAPATTEPAPAPAK